MSRSDVINRLRELHWLGPEQGTRHAFMRRGDRTIRIPNDHGSEISVPLLAQLLREAGISRDDWLIND